MTAKSKEPRRRVVNKNAFRDYIVLERTEAGFVLTGTEVKSLRAGNAQLAEAFVRISGYEVRLYGCQIDRYPPASERNHDPQRVRKLLLHRREIHRLAPKLNQPGTTLIPLSIYFNDRGLAKVELGLAVGKKRYDKRQELRKKEHRREMDRATRRRSPG